MAVGVIFSNKPIKGSCGGLNALGMKEGCEICGGDDSKCETTQKKAAGKPVGVLMALADLVPRGTRNPFPVICGTSAGAINAAALSANAHNYRMAVRGLERVWANITPEQVYRTDFWTFLKSIIKWSLSGVLTGDTPVHSALLDSEPLEKLLNLVINFNRIQHAIDAGDLRALSITASSYATGESVAFFQGQDDLEEWTRARRLGRKTRIRA
ncbi:PNPLA domain-containing protein, partial [Durusdinium trenchii]